MEQRRKAFVLSYCKIHPTTEIGGFLPFIYFRIQVKDQHLSNTPAKLPEGGYPLGFYWHLLLYKQVMIELEYSDFACSRDDNGFMLNYFVLVGNSINRLKIILMLITNKNKIVQHESVIISAASKI
jgi:hypothetical protein